MQKLKVEYQRKEDRGTLTQVNTGDWKQLNILEIKKGNTFGGHYHKEKEELFYVVFGKVNMMIQNQLEESPVCVEILSKGDCILIEPYEEHSLIAIQDTTIVEVLSQPYSETDTYEY